MAVLAKLSRPRLAGVYPRERLFARLDECRRHAAVWISGPPGAGKTTLTASYLDARGLPALWYQVDAGDADPASFFYYLGLGARQAGLSRKTHLPLLTPEYMLDLAGSPGAISAPCARACRNRACWCSTTFRTRRTHRPSAP